MSRFLAYLIATTALLLAAPSIATAGVAPQNEVWTYRDLADAAAKTEGGYVLPSSESSESPGPHGGYDTTTSKCKVCHAAHRSGSAYYLTRADALSDACEYCHIDSTHSSSNVYSANDGGTQTGVGHRIGAARWVPASTRGFVSLETTDLAVTDLAGQEATYTVDIRSVEESGTGIFKMERRHGHTEAGPAQAGYARLGPVSLTCMSCHVTHGAPAQMWQPSQFPDNTASDGSGYKLLRRNPSGSIYGPDDEPYGNGGPDTVSYTTDGMLDQKAYTEFRTTGLVNATATIEAPETTLTADAIGYGKTIWDTAPFDESSYLGADSATEPASSTVGVNEYALSAWCADCHNLAIGEHGDSAFHDVAAHETSRTHTVPMTPAGNGPGQCYSCHRADLTPRPLTAAYDSASAVHCETCHYGTGSYAVDPERTSGDSDFPHSAETSSAYLLGAWTVDATGSVIATAVTEENARELVCIRCHRTGEGTHDHLSAVASESIAGTLTDSAGDPYYYESPNEDVVATYSDQECGLCHRMDLRREHEKPTSSSAASECLACHPTPRDQFESWDKTCTQSGCHTVTHDSTTMYGKHAQASPPPSQASCGYESKCHDEWNNWDVAMIHANAWYEWSNGQWKTVTPSEPLPQNGCALCHRRAADVPVEKDCGVCHPSLPEGHPSTESSGT